MLAAAVYPHQLYLNQPAAHGASVVYLVEDPLFFRQYAFHQNKLVLHRASMRYYADSLRDDGHEVRYVEAASLGCSGDLAKLAAGEGVTELAALDPHDDWLLRRLRRGCESSGVELQVLEDPNFLTTSDQIRRFADGRRELYFTEFYIWQRKRLKVLLEPGGKPAGGRWSYDADNRQKLPRDLRVPELRSAKGSAYVAEARLYVERNFPEAVGTSEDFNYPVDHVGASEWFDHFVESRFAHFGSYEDAIAADEKYLFHAVLTPPMNVGLITPHDVLAAVAEPRPDVPLNSHEGFVRQVVGWREYIRMVYLLDGGRERTSNFWGFTRKLPAAFYDGSTGVEPFDRVVHRVLQSGYCHHIERLMVLGNFMLLCRIHPDEVYRWFMEMFVDSYDWVMVPNVYAMSQYADGGAVTTKPYLSGSAYIRRMSDFKAGPWCEVWDGLFWSFIADYRDVFAANPRLALMPKQLDRMGAAKMERHRKVAEEFLSGLG